MAIIYRGAHPYRIESVWGAGKLYCCRTYAGHVYQIRARKGWDLPKPGDDVRTSPGGGDFWFDHQSPKRRAAKPVEPFMSPAAPDEIPAHTAPIWKDGRVMNKGAEGLWSGKGPVPAIGTVVTCNDKVGTQVTVTGYTVEDGWLMVRGFRTAEPAKVGNLAGMEIRWPKVEPAAPIKAGPVATKVMRDIMRVERYPATIYREAGSYETGYAMADAAGLDFHPACNVAWAARRAADDDTMNLRGSDAANPTSWARDPIVRRALRLLAVNELAEQAGQLPVFPGACSDVVARRFACAVA